MEAKRPWAELRPLSSWPGQVTVMSVTCTAGWTADTLPRSLRAWALNRIAALYDVRTDMAAGIVAAAMPRNHTDGLLDRWLVTGGPYAR